jgi:superfamily I DNA and/or RNA helicase
MVAVKTDQKADRRLAFDTVIIDEAARANPLDLFIPMSLARRKIILVGDHRQLPHSLEPDVENELDRHSSKETAEVFRTSLFERLFGQMKRFEKEDGISRTVTLDTQYRMHPILGQFVSETFYERHGDPKIASGRDAAALAHSIAPYAPAVAAWVDIPVGLGAERGDTSKCRPQEAEWIAKELQRLTSVIRDCSFGVITFYSEQERELWRALAKRGLAEEGEDGGYRPSARCQPFVSSEGKLVEPLRVGTVDAFQGKEFDVVFLSMTRSNTIPADEVHSRQKYGHLMLENRLCVAMSRQKRLLVVVGDSTMLRAANAEASIRSLVAFRKLCEGTNGICL